MRNAVTLRIVAVVLSACSAPQPCAAQAGTPAEALAEALNRIVERLNDEAVKRQLDRELARLEPVLKRDICGRRGGAVIFVDMYRPRGGSGHVLRGLIDFRGECPAGALAGLEESLANSIIDPPAAGYEPDLENSFGIWVTCPADEIRTWQTIRWPVWAQLAVAEKPGCPELLLSRYAIEATTISSEPGASVVEYVVTQVDSGAVLASFERSIPAEVEAGTRRYELNTLPGWAREWSEDAWRQFVLREVAPARDRQ